MSVPNLGMRSVELLEQTFCTAGEAFHVQQFCEAQHGIIWGDALLVCQDRSFMRSEVPVKAGTGVETPSESL